MHGGVFAWAGYKIATSNYFWTNICTKALSFNQSTKALSWNTRTAAGARINYFLIIFISYFRTGKYYYKGIPESNFTDSITTNGDNLGRIVCQTLGFDDVNFIGLRSEYIAHLNGSYNESDYCNIPFRVGGVTCGNDDETLQSVNILNIERNMRFKYHFWNTDTYPLKAANFSA